MTRCPAMSRTPAKYGCSSGMTPLAIAPTTTGTPAEEASAASSWPARPRTAPAPASTTGRRAAASSPASARAGAAPRGAGRVKIKSGRGGSSGGSRTSPAPSSVTAWPKTSCPTVRWTAPGRSATAVRRARRITVSAEGGSSRAVSFVTGENSRSWSMSWCVQYCSRRLSTCPDTAISGTRSSWALATPLSTAVDPGPSVDTTAPGRPVAMAAPSAMNAALASRAADTTVRPPTRAASMKSTIDSPG